MDYKDADEEEQEVEEEESEDETEGDGEIRERKRERGRWEKKEVSRLDCHYFRTIKYPKAYRRHIQYNEGEGE